MKDVPETKRSRYCIVLNISAIIIGLCLWISYPSFIDKLIDHVLNLNPNSPFFDEWKSSSVPVVVSFYLWNWTNSEALKEVGVKPRFEQVGPYVFKQTYYRENLVYNGDNQTLTFRNKRFFYFDERSSVGNQQEQITLPNLVPLVAVDTAREWNSALKKLLSIAFSIGGIPYHIKRTVDEFLFSGFQDPFIDVARTLPFNGAIPIKDKVGWFYGRNGSSEFEGIYNIGTGLGNTTINNIYTWNYERRTYYKNRCGELGQSMPEFFPQNVQPTTIRFFMADLGRMAVFDFEEAVTYEGIEAYKFVGNVSFLDCGIIKKENECMCHKKVDKYGAVNFLKDGVSGFVTLPHFLYADSSFRTDIEGMKPDNQEHSMYILVNPRTGIILKANLAMQFNLLMAANEEISLYRDVPTIMFPLVWLKSTVQLPNKYLWGLKLLGWAPVIFITISSFLILVGVIFLIRNVYIRPHKRKLNTSFKFEENKLLECNIAKETLNEK